MTDKEFVTFLEHFIFHFKTSIEDPILSLLDNHGSHNSMEGIHLAHTNAISTLKFPPRCTHKLQPLDVSVFGPFTTNMLFRILLLIIVAQ